MPITRLDRRYAKPLLELSIEIGKLKKVKKDIDCLIAVIKESKDFRLLIESPIINSDIKSGIFEKLFANSFQKLTFDFLQIIIRKNRERDLASIARGFEELYYKYKDIQRAVVTTAKPLFAEQNKKLKQKLNQTMWKDVIIEEKIDPSIIGGIIIRLDDKQYNGSVAHQLNLLKQQFRNN